MDIGFDAGPERFATLLVLRLCRPWLAQLPNIMAAARRFSSPVLGARHNFYLEPNTFPNDVDTTSVATAGLFESGISDEGALRGGANELCKALFVPDNVRATKYLPIPRNAGVAMVYWLDAESLPPFFSRPQFDPAVAANALYAAYLAAERGLPEVADHFEPTWRYVVEHLGSARSREGTLYYPSPDSFLCLFALVCGRFPQRVDESLAAALQRALALREESVSDDPIKDPRSALNRAQRVIAARALNAAAGRELVRDVPRMQRELAQLQGPNGLWQSCALYGYGPLPYFIGSRELTTAYAISALGGEVVSSRISAR
jgi:hypothetical protein